MFFDRAGLNLLSQHTGGLQQRVQVTPPPGIAKCSALPIIFALLVSLTILGIGIRGLFKRVIS
jgi:hypothetical protein